MAEKGFNALPRAFFFSTKLLSGLVVGLKYVSMPYHGLSSFLLVKAKKNRKTGEMFQCPTTGFLLFYAMSLHPLKLLALQIRFCV